MHKIIVLSSFEEDPIHSKIKDLLKVHFSSFSPRYYLYSDTNTFQTDILSPSLFSEESISILEKVPVSSLEKLLSSLLVLSYRPPLILTTGYIKIADPLRNYLLSQQEISFLPLKKPDDSLVASKINQLAAVHGHKIEETLLSYFLFLYKDSFSSIELDLSPFFIGMPPSTSALTLYDFIGYRTSSSFDLTYYLDKLLHKDFLFLLPFETLPSSDIIPFLRFLNFSFTNLLSPLKRLSSSSPLSWSTKDILKIIDLFHTLEIQTKKSLFPSFNVFLSTFQIMLLKQQQDVH